MLKSFGSFPFIYLQCKSFSLSWLFFFLFHDLSNLFIKKKRNQLPFLVSLIKIFCQFDFTPYSSSNLTFDLGNLSHLQLYQIFVASFIPLKTDVVLPDELLILNKFLDLTQQSILPELAVLASQLLGSLVNKTKNGN